MLGLRFSLHRSAVGLCETMLKRTLKIYSLFWHVLALWMIHASRSSSIPKNARLAPQILATLSAQVAAPVGTRAPRGGRFWRFASLRCDPSPRVVLSPPPAPPASIRGDTWYGGARRRCLGSASARGRGSCGWIIPRLFIWHFVSAPRAVLYDYSFAEVWPICRDLCHVIGDLLHDSDRLWFSWRCGCEKKTRSS